MQEDTPDIKYLKIVYDDINQLIELVESYQDTVNSTRELYTANVSLQMNDTVRTLTLFSAILLPLTFISSVYGMNGLDLNNILKMPIGLYDSNAHNGNSSRSVVRILQEKAVDLG